jgi:hypothetical protein
MGKEQGCRVQDRLDFHPVRCDHYLSLNALFGNTHVSLGCRSLGYGNRLQGFIDFVSFSLMGSSLLTFIIVPLSWEERI